MLKTTKWNIKCSNTLTFSLLKGEHTLALYDESLDACLVHVANKLHLIYISRARFPL